MIEPDSKIIIDIILNRARPELIDWEKIDLKKLLVHASHNRVLYLFVKNLLDSDTFVKSVQPESLNILKEIRKEGEGRLEALKRTLILLEEVFKKQGLDYLIVKTFKFLDYITFDVDILVRYEDFEKAIKALENNQIEVGSHPNRYTQGRHQRNCFKQGYLKMDLHRQFFWLGIEHLDLDFVWNRTAEREIAGVNCLTPSLEADFLLYLSQLAYERRYITLLDFLAAKYANDKGLNWPLMIAQIKKHKHEKTFFALLNWFNYIHREIFGEEMVDLSPYFGKQKRQIQRKKLDLPLILPTSESLAVFKEVFFKQKRAPVLELGYYFFAMARYLANNRLPFYDHWYDFNKKR